MVFVISLTRTFVLAAVSAIALTFLEPVGAEVFTAGGYSFSDELGNFRITAISGTGTSTDPVVLHEEIVGTGPAILVIRRITPKDIVPDRHFTENWRALTLIKLVRNNTRRIWVGFDLELQEVLDKPSIYSDGLSFNQIGAQPPDVASDDFAGNVRLFEPYDRVRFRNGHVNPEATVLIKVHITDPTPEATFYLLQDPQILYASLR